MEEKGEYKGVLNSVEGITDKIWRLSEELTDAISTAVHHGYRVDVRASTYGELGVRYPISVVRVDISKGVDMPSPTPGMIHEPKSGGK